MSEKEVVVDPLTRIEGHLKIRAKIDDSGNVVDESPYSSGTLYRGFENIMAGNDPVDAIHISSRFCGVCYLAHATASTRALEELYDVTPPKQGRIMRNIANGAQAIEDHAEIIYALGLPDLASPRYVDPDEGILANYSMLRKELIKRFAAINDPHGPGDSYLKAVEARKEVAKVPGIINGMSPHPRTFAPGGISYVPTYSDLSKMAGLWERAVKFVEEVALGRPGDPITYQTYMEKANEWSKSDQPLTDILEWVNTLIDEKGGISNIGDIPLILKYGALNDIKGEPNLKMHRYGNTNQLLMSYGGWEEWEDEEYLGSGVYDIQTGDLSEVDTGKIKEYVTNSYYKEGTGGHFSEETTEPKTDLKEEDFNTYEPEAEYTWTKAPRYNGKPAEVGPLARMAISDPTGLIPNIVQSKEWDQLELNPVNTFTRIIARAHNLLILVPKILEWVKMVDPEGRFYNEPDWEQGKNSEGIGMWEPPRGSLLHYVSTDGKGKIDKYQAVVPTTWNMSPRGPEGKMGPYEQAVNSIGPDINGSLPEKAENPVQLFHTIRSFDPCIACAVHTIDSEGNQNEFDSWRS
ncbi:MAG: NiFe-hydrogenase I large subunit HyaB [Candidatus Methanohalarchaeum thermophilum]|uniref:NiFe-hydrogenase I large subunit HyaB n=1 Tax=Methanohalarchaeum thermophilum TaxID=1903181 RepID=A0A1Q6DS39_METT1|nr:MAG: NiFe-hydrogenase I large subunit HyaB [Candidatus Methanohalarchaeum thermophilum]